MATRLPGRLKSIDNAMISIIDYGMGNIYSVQSALKYLGCNSIYTDSKKRILSSSHIILPGVGSFREAMNTLTQKNLDTILKEAVKKKIPLLGICLGMQLLGKSSTEDGFVNGLGFIDGIVEKFQQLGTQIKVPHIGFNTVSKVNNSSILLKDFQGSSDFYFVHSYRMLCSDESCTGESQNGENFAACVEKKNVFGTQFHPEKSQSNGLKVLIRFLEQN